MFTFKLLRVERYFAVRRDMNKILQLNVLISLDPEVQSFSWSSGSRSDNMKLNNCCVLMKYTQVIRSAFYIF